MSIKTDKKAKCPNCNDYLRNAVQKGPKEAPVLHACPECSRNAGTHIFWPMTKVGQTKLRSSANKPNGSQSWCKWHRSKKEPPTAPTEKQRCENVKVRPVRFRT